MLSLKPITKDNWLQAISLNVREDQEDFVASNAFSLAQLNYLDHFYAKGIYLDEQMIGFALYGIDEEDQAYWLYRFMIDARYQGNGYGAKAVQLIIEDVKEMKEPHHTTLTLSYEPENQHARYLYQKAGFKEVEGLFSDGEQIARLTC